MLHRTVFEELGLFNQDLIQLCDIEFWIRVGIHYGIVYVPHTLATFRVHSGGATLQNEGRKSFQKNKLDSLILLHEFAYNEAFRPLRDAARRRTPRLDFAKELAENPFGQEVGHSGYVRKETERHSMTGFPWRRGTQRCGSPGTCSCSDLSASGSGIWDGDGRRVSALRA